MRKMYYNKGSRKTRVYHLPLDGYTQILDTLDFFECNNDDFQTRHPTCSPSSLSNSSSVDEGNLPTSLPFSLSNSLLVNDLEGQSCSPSPTWLPFSLTNSSSKKGHNGPSSLPISLSISSSVDDQSGSDYSINFSLSNSSSVNDDHTEYDRKPSLLSNSSSENDSGPSLPFWMMSKSEAETSHLLGENNSKNHQSFGFIQTFSEGKRFITPDILENIPDLLHELSFRDIIDDDHLATYAYVEEGDIIMEGETLDKPKNIVKCPEIRRKKLSNGQIITKNQSMNSAVFLLKMFVPISLRSKTKSRNCSKIIPGTSFDLIENALSKQLSQRLDKNKSKGIDGFSNITTQKRLVGGKFLSCFCKMSDSQRYIGNALLNDGCNR